MSLSKDLIFLILQFCNEENLTKTAHMLGKETGFFFDMLHFEALVLCGNWDETEDYLSGFTGLSDNKYSMKIYFEIRKQKFLEALDRQDHKTALDILLKDLKVFAELNEELYREMSQLLTLDDFREYAPLASYGDIISARKHMINELKAVIVSNPKLQGRLEFPALNKSRLRRLINQSLNWQHMHCENPQPEPEIKTLFTDHKCPRPEDQSVTLCEERPKPGKTILCAKPAFPEMFSNSSIVTDDMVSATTTSKAVQDSDNLYDVSSTGYMNEKVLSTTVPCENQDALSNLSDDFPKAVERVLNIGCSPTTMDFHPVQQTLLIVGDSVGGVELWDVSCEEKLFSINFMIWNLETVSPAFLVSIGEDPHISVNRILWSSDGSLFGVASSKSIVQLYYYHNKNNHAENHLEIEAHSGSVNDLVFSKPNNKLFVITCGDDKLVKVWNTENGARLYTFEGHGAPVYSLCPHEKEDYHFVFSTSTNGEIKAWLYDNLGPRVSYEAPSYCCMRMLYSADGKRLFSCGTNKGGESHIVEWNETEGYIDRSYLGLGRCSSSVVQFDLSSNKYVAAGDSHVIKVWNVNDSQLLTVVDAGGDLPASPFVRFNKKGTLLAVFVDDNMIKILANDCGRSLLQTSLDASKYLSYSIRKLAGYSLSGPANSRSTDDIVPLENTADNLESMEPHKILGNQSISKVVQVLQCQSLRLPSEVKTNRVWRLLYTQAGNALLALVADGIHLHWRWSKTKSNPTGQTTTKCTPQLWQPRSGVLLTNSLPSTDAGAVSPCITLTKNDSYAISASGGGISIFNIPMFKKMKSIMAPTPAATCIACHPSDNNVIVVGMDDSTIIVYHVRVNEVIRRLKGHSKRITGLALSNILNVLVSSGADSQIVVWDSIKWEKEGSSMLQMLPTETFVEYDRDEKELLVVDETRIAIYETRKLECVKQWMINNLCARISHATFSCDSEWIYAVMKDGLVLILSASDLSPKYEIDPSTILPSPFSSCNVLPLVVAAHPKIPDQFALGLNDGGVVIIEPPNSDGRWPKLHNQQLV